jgi:hypothetical protein
MAAPTAPANSGMKLARLFGWQEPDLSHRDVHLNGTHLDVARGSVGTQPAALFATVAARNGYDPLDSAALYAYHATIRWGVLADDVGFTVFNSHWLADGVWFRLPHITWQNLTHRSDISQALTPQGVFERTIDRVATREKEPRDLLEPVDDELVERLDAWRDEAARYSRDGTSIDETLQTLFAQLFVLRIVEDRELEPDIPTVLSTVTGSDLP